MHSTNTFDILLWALVGIVGSGMIAFLLLGALKGMYWERQLKLKRKSR